MAQASAMVFSIDDWYWFGLSHNVGGADGSENALNATTDYAHISLFLAISLLRFISTLFIG
jgi:hypothetical protein